MPESFLPRFSFFPKTDFVPESGAGRGVSENDGAASLTASGKERRCKIAAPFMVLLLCFILSIAQFPFKGQAAGSSTADASFSDSELARMVDPSPWRLSSEAEHLYYFLLLSDALADNSQRVISLALKGLLKHDPSLQVFQDSATILLARGEYSSTESTAQEGLRKFPDDTLLTLLLAGAFSERGHVQKAIEILEKHRTIKPDETMVSEELVRLYLKAGQDQKASDLLTSIPRVDQSAEAELFRVGVLSTVGRNAEAREILQRLLEKQPGFFEGWLELAYIAEREKNTEEAIKAYSKAAEIMPENSELQFRLAVLYIEQKKPEKALQALENADPSPSLFMQASLRFAEAGLYKEAVVLLEKAAQYGGDPDQLALLLSMLHQESSDDPLAGLDALEAIAPSSDMYPSAIQQKARIYIQGKEYAKAYSVALEGRKRFPDHKELWGLEAYALVKMKKNEEAEKLLKQSLAQYPDDEELLFSLGSIQDETGKKTAAMKTMEHIIALNPKNYQALNYVGYTLAEGNKDLNRALKLITTALELRPEADYIMDSLAWVQYRLGRMDEAWENINRCISLGGDEATIWEHYGDIALALGKREDAAKGYAEAILRKPDNIAEVRKKLTELQK